MAWDLSVDLIKATVQLEQPLGDGSRTVGTGFLVSDPTPDGKPRTILVTAAHVFEKMPSVSARIGYRIQGAEGVWRYDPESLTIRDGDHPLWTKHPTRDVAVMVVEAPPEFAKAAIPLNYLAQDDTFNKFNLGPGDEMMALGFPRGLSANPAGFPILRSGRVASYPLAPATNFPTFLMDFSVFPGNSGGPVFMAEGARRRPGASESQEVQFVAGLLTQQVELSGERLEIGIVTHAKFIRETLALLDKVPGAAVTQARAPRPEPAMPGATPAAAVSAMAMGASH
ncbi:serine protease [Caulobacter sp. X]|uniref:trypsin-like serine peptidase n=1 Tax=Caulobacter sp. X TaxID=2048901 RepID=UPI000C151A4A|nr:serine protease [Caulobacter sp. X]PIC01163.1 peptidase S1 [Caulobacter sp. X]